MQKLLINITVMAVLTVAAPIALATTRTIPLPHPSHYADTESSTNVVLVGWNDQTRRFLVDLVAAATPCNCLELAYGTDANNDNILAPEETDLRLGLDCGEGFISDEKNGGEALLPRRKEDETSLFRRDKSVASPIASRPHRVSIAPNPYSLPTPSSSVSHGLTPSNTYLIAWQNACVERSATNRVNAAIELFPDGSATTIWQPLNLNQQPITNNRCLRPASTATARMPTGFAAISRFFSPSTLR